MPFVAPVREPEDPVSLPTLLVDLVVALAAVHPAQSDALRGELTTADPQDSEPRGM